MGSYLFDNDNQTQQLDAGKYIAEPCMWFSKWIHQGNLTSVMDTLIFRVEAEEFVNVLSQFEFALHNPQSYARQFFKEMLEALEEGRLISDLPLNGFEID